MDVKLLNELAPWEWPEGADTMLLTVLRNDRADESDRLLAAEMAGDLVVVNDALVGTLLSILGNGDSSPELRETAAAALGPVLEHADIEEFDDPDEVPISEEMFLTIKESLQKLYMDADTPKTVRRRILEASVHAPDVWHQGAVRAAYAGDDADWRLTAVFSMRWVRGFEPQILEALESENPNLHYQAVCAAGNWGIKEAWSHITGLLTLADTEKSLLLAAIDAVVEIRPDEAGMVLVELTESDDDDIVEAAHEAIAMAQAIDEYENHEDLDEENEGV